jgi:Fe-S cluster biogenesis protein NfuA
MDNQANSPSPVSEPTKITMEWTPNPNAMKFIMDRDARTGGKVSFPSREDGEHVPLAKALFDLIYVEQVHFFENVVTVTKNDSVSWDRAEGDVKEVLTRLMPGHDANFTAKNPDRRSHQNPELQKIDEIIDRTIRPGLQGDGGDLELISLEGKMLTIAYQGACGSCPSSIGGTLGAIEGILRDQYDPEIQVVTA